jgi:glucan 1,3-beta-glucosidase
MALENLSLDNVPVIIQGPSGTLLSGSSGSMTVSGWGEGHLYAPSGPSRSQGPITGNSRPSNLLSGDVYYSRSKPQYQSLASSDFVSVRSAGCRGDGSTDDVRKQSWLPSAARQTWL